MSKDKSKELYAKAAIFILASERENASTALLEALASGCAIITTNVSGCPETVGHAAELVDFGDSKSLQEKIKLVISKCENKQKIALEKAKEYDINMIVQKNYELLKFVAENKYLPLEHEDYHRLLSRRVS